MTSLTFSPMLPLVLLGLLAGIAVISALLRGMRSAAAGAIQLLGTLFGVVFLLSPQITVTDGEAIPDLAVILSDTSRSVSFGDRNTIVEATSAKLSETLTAMGLDVRQASFGGPTESNLAEGVERALTDISRNRLAGVFAVTDGQVSGETANAAIRIESPLHALVTGNPQTERDRRIELVAAPRYGLVGETVNIRLRILSPGEQGSLPATLYVGGEVYTETNLPIGEIVTLSVPLAVPGDRLIELEVAASPAELTELNNRAVAVITAVRDRLRVLLVSGEPHAGERVWRNILKSDPAVDLVHFTILKPQNKVAVAREEELNLIQFPHIELFLEKLPDFDVLIFDRYTYRNVLESFEFEEIARYVENGGAVLIASGPEYAESGSLANRPNLAYILPALPAGAAREGAFIPQRSALGQKHPVTRSLDGEDQWGRWLRYIPIAAPEGQVLMTGPEGAPLLVVDRVGEGRIGVLLSDHVWLWARGFDGGGPHRELLRRLVHWLMKEPELEEEALSGRLEESGQLRIERQSLEAAPQPVQVTSPRGETQTVPVEEVSPGQFEALLPGGEPGLYRLRSQTAEGRRLYALASSAEGGTSETEAVITTTEKITPITEETGGGTFIIRSAQSPLPDIRMVGDGRRAAGRDWAGLVRRNVMTVQSVRQKPLLSAPLSLAFIGGAILLAWLIEGRNFRRSS